MCKRRNFLPLILFTLTILTFSCKDKVNDQSTETDENLVDFYISSNDSNIQLQFSNFKLNPDSFEIILNGNKAPYTLGSDKLLTIRKDIFEAGKNTIDLSYSKDAKKETLSKTYFNTFNLSYEIVNTTGHNRNYFTQGLLFDEAGSLIESTGLTGESKIIFYRDFRNGYRPGDSIVNEKQEFGEGIVIFNGQIVQLLWKNMYLKIYDRNTRKLIKNLDYNKEGWGICSDANILYTSDGSNNIHVIDISGSLTRVTRSISVQDEKGPVANINELEFIDGKIYANIWQSNFIFIIDPATGFVLGKMDMTQLAQKELKINPDIDVLNGIAYNPAKKTLLLTGKYWSNFYEIRIKDDLYKPAK